MKTTMALTDRDLATLVDSIDPEVRAAATTAAERLAAPARWPALPSHVAAFVADVLAEARTEGRLIWRTVGASYCRYCNARSTWQKPKRRRTEVEIKVSSVEFAYRFITIAGHVSVGACRACVDEALPILRTELAMFPVELPQALLAKDATLYRRWNRCTCKTCGWSGHEGQLGKLRTLLGDGYYPGKCPSCGAEKRPLGRDVFDRGDGFEVVEERAA